MFLDRYFEKSYFFGIAVTDYPEMIGTLKTPANDIAGIAEVLGDSVHGFERQLLSPDETDRDGILNFLDRMVETANKPAKPGGKNKNRVIFYFAGHGKSLQNRGGGETGYLIPSGGTVDDISSWISMETLVRRLNRLECPHLLVILDCCFAGSLKWAIFNVRGGAVNPQELFEEHIHFYAIDRAWQAITSAAFDQVAIDIGWRNRDDLPKSPFAMALIDCLNGAADVEKKGVITATALIDKLRSRVEKFAAAEGVKFGQSPQLHAFKQHGRGEFLFLNPAHPLNLQTAMDAIYSNCPFKGLEAYQEEDTARFFGRSAEVDKLTDEVMNLVTGSGQRLLVISGVSGSGKSSLVYAGVIPALRKRDVLPAAVIRPGATPLEQLGKVFDLEEDGRDFLFIDQFEEIFLNGRSAGEIQLFIDKLLRYIQGSKHLVILTVRSDFEHLVPAGEFRDIWIDRKYGVPWFSRDELREIILKPAVDMAFFYQPELLVERIIDSVLNYPGSLPMLSVLLQQLYYRSIDNLRGRFLHEDDYFEIGGISGALQSVLDELSGSSPDEEKILIAILLRMLTINKGIYAKKQVAAKEFDFEDEMYTQSISRQLSKLEERRIINRTEDGTGWAPVHDAVVNWEKIEEAVEKIGLERMGLQAELQNGITSWQHNGSGKAGTWASNPRLKLLLGETKRIPARFPVPLLNKSELDFIRLSNRRKRVGQLTQIFAITFAFFTLAVLLVYYLNSNYKLNSTVEQKTRAQNAADSILRVRYLADLQKQANAGDDFFQAFKVTGQRNYLDFARNRYENAQHLLNLYKDKPEFIKKADSIDLQQKRKMCRDLLKNTYGTTVKTKVR